MSATLESRTLIVSARRLRVLKAALAGMEIEAIEPAEWVTTGVRAKWSIPFSPVLKDF